MSTIQDYYNSQPTYQEEMEIKNQPVIINAKKDIYDELYLEEEPKNYKSTKNNKIKYPYLQCPYKALREFPPIEVVLASSILYKYTKGNKTKDGYVAIKNDDLIYLFKSMNEQTLIKYIKSLEEFGFFETRVLKNKQYKINLLVYEKYFNI